MSEKNNPDKMASINFIRSPLTSGDKWTISILAAILFIIVSLPFVYGLTDSLFSGVGLSTTSVGGPTLTGIFIHALVFMLLLRLLLW